VGGHRAGGQAQQRTQRLGADEGRVGQDIAERVVDAVVDGVAVPPAQPGGDVAGDRGDVLAVLTETISGQRSRTYRLTLGRVVSCCRGGREAVAAPLPLPMADRMTT